MHKQLEDQFFGRDDIAFFHIQTVFEGEFTNDFNNGLRDIDEYGLLGAYGFDPSPPGARAATMAMFNTGGTPYTIIIDKAGQVVESDFTKFESQLRPIINSALAE